MINSRGLGIHLIATAFLTLVFFSSTSASAAQGSGEALDAAVADCIEDHIATGKYFLINSTTGRPNLKDSSLRLIVACEKQVSAWVNHCEKETKNSKGCTRMSMTVTQSLVQDAWNHRSNLKKWRSR